MGGWVTTPHRLRSTYRSKHRLFFVRTYRRLLDVRVGEDLVIGDVLDGEHDVDLVFVATTGPGLGLLVLRARLHDSAVGGRGGCSGVGLWFGLVWVGQRIKMEIELEGGESKLKANTQQKDKMKDVRSMGSRRRSTCGRAKAHSEPWEAHR